jgi:hypothetical protein
MPEDIDLHFDVSGQRAHPRTFGGLTSLSIPKFDLTIEAGAEKPPAIVGEGDVFDSTRVADESPQDFSVVVHVPKLI